MMLNFKDWLKESATTTACVANFARPVGGMIKPKPVDVVGEKKKKKD